MARDTLLGSQVVDLATEGESRSSDLWETAFNDAMETVGDQPVDDAPSGATDAFVPPVPVEGTDTPPVAPPATPDEVVPPATAGRTAEPDTDPFKDAKPYEYKGKDGSAKALDGSYLLLGDGLYVPEANLGTVQQLFEQVERIPELERDITTVKGELGAFHRLSAWQTGRDAQNQPIVATGMAGFTAQRESHAESLAFKKTMTEFVRDPLNLASLLMYDENNALIANPQGFRNLEAILKAETTDARYKARDGVSRIAAAPPEAPKAVDPTSFADGTIADITRQYNIQGLTAEDVAALKRDFTHYVVRQPNGSLAVAENLVHRMKEVAQLRVASKAPVPSRAAAFNAGMQQGKLVPKPAARAAAPAQPTRTSTTSAPKALTRSRNDAWNDLIAEAQSVV